MAQRGGQDQKPPRPLSRGTDISDIAETEYPETESPQKARKSIGGGDVDRAMSVSPIEEQALSGGSDVPLQMNDEDNGQQVYKPRPTQRLSVAIPHDNVPMPEKSPRSIRASLLGTSNGRQNGHERLPSATSTQQEAKEHAKLKTKQNLGKRYEYFPGNTVFCLGGRLQNTREKPINIATAIFLLVPIALYFPYT